MWAVLLRFLMIAGPFLLAVFLPYLGNTVLNIVYPASAIDLNMAGITNLPNATRAVMGMFRIDDCLGLIATAFISRWAVMHIRLLLKK